MFMSLSLSLFVHVLACSHGSMFAWMQAGTHAWMVVPSFLSPCFRPSICLLSLFVCPFDCKCACKYAYMCMCICVCVYVRTCACMPVRMYVCTYVCMSV